MSDNYMDLELFLQKIYLLAANADRSTWQYNCELIQKYIYGYLNLEDEKNNKS